MRIVKNILLLLLILGCLGMGGLGGHPEGVVPETEVDLQVRMIDRSGVITEMTQFSMNGKIILKAQRGRGTLTIPFQKMTHITFGEVNNNEVSIEVGMKSGTVMHLTVWPRAQFFGSTSDGAFQIRASDVAEIHFL